MATLTDSCPVCGSTPVELPSVRSDFSKIEFALRQCPACGLSFVANPRTDFADLYGGEYYAGRGADAMVDYIGEMENPRTVRAYEWRGVVRAVTSITGSTNLKWLDYGCGLGGLVRYAQAHGMPNVVGFDEGWSWQWMLDHGIPCLTKDELAEQVGAFDVVTAIEVIEHVTDPVGMMSHIASLLKPGGLVFLTTGNAEPHRAELTNWSYVNPDVHVAYFEPRTLAEVYARSGLEAYYAGFLPGFDDIIRYKVLKTFRVSTRHWLERLAPWCFLSRIVDRRHHVTAHPLARRPVS